MSSKFFDAWRFDEAGASSTGEWVVEEGPLQVRVNGKSFTVTLRTPGADRELAMGLLFSESIVDAPGDILSLKQESGGEPGAESGAVWSAEVKPREKLTAKLANRSLASTSSCGYCGKTEWEDPNDTVSGGACADNTGVTLSAAFLEVCFARMRERQGVFDRTGGCHAAAVFSAEGALLAFGEDVGRHNAVDKAIGDLWERGGLARGAVLCVSGRVSYEIVSKTLRAGFPVLAAVSAPSSQAVEFSRESGITLIGFCRGPRATVYSHPERMATLPETSPAAPPARP